MRTTLFEELSKEDLLRRLNEGDAMTYLEYLIAEEAEYRKVRAETNKYRNQRENFYQIALVVIFLLQLFLVLYLLFGK